MQTSEQERSEPKKEQSRHLLTALHLVKNLGADMFRHYRWRVIAIIIADGLVMVCTLLSLTGIFLVFVKTDAIDNNLIIDGIEIVAQFVRDYHDDYS